MTRTVVEQRRELRRPASGLAVIRFSDPEPLEILGRLVDLSHGGFRMAHDCTWLTAGQTVDFRHPEASGRARVMWNRVLDDRVETGFLVL